MFYAMIAVVWFRGYDMEQREPYRVLIIHNYYQIQGGEDTVVSNEKRLLEKHRHAVFFYMRENREIQEFSLFQKLCLPFTAIFSWRTYREVKALIKREHIDIVHVHNTLSLISPAVYYAAFLCRVPVVQTVHNFRLLCPAATFVKKNTLCEDCLKKGLYCSVKGRCYRGSYTQTLVSALTLKLHRTTGIFRKINYICLTEFNKRKLLQLNSRGRQSIIPKRIFVKPNFVQEEGIRPVQKRKNQFIYVGRLDTLKGIRVLLEAWKEIDDLELLLCGTGPEEGWVKQFLKEHGMNQVQLLGSIKHEQVLKLLAESQALIMPTQWYEGQPMVILESYSVGTPVIGSRLGNVKDMILEGVTGVTFAWDSSEELCETVRTFPEFDSNVIQQYFQERYTAEKNYKMLIEIYRQIIEDM